jgi:hypothetical protein
LIDTQVPYTKGKRHQDDQGLSENFGCFGTLEGADIFCGVFLPKKNLSASNALNLLSDGKLPEFIL